MQKKNVQQQEERQQDVKHQRSANKMSDKKELDDISRNEPDIDGVAFFSNDTERYYLKNSRGRFEKVTQKEFEKDEDNK